MSLLRAPPDKNRARSLAIELDSFVRLCPVIQSAAEVKECRLHLTRHVHVSQ